MQLQRHAAKGDFAAALESIFSIDSSSSSSSAAPGSSSSVANTASLTSHMEVVDAVLRLAADASSSNAALAAFTQCAAYRAIVGLESLEVCSDGGAGASLLGGLNDDLQANVLKLCIWRLVRRILQHPPPFELRISLGPKFIPARSGGDAAYNRNNFPPAPSYMAAEVQGNFSRVHGRSLAGWCSELGLPSTLPESQLAHSLCQHLQQQELALLWAMQCLSVRTTGPQLESTLVGLTTSAERSKLAQLAVLMTSLGECVKAQGPGERKMMWVYAALRHLPVAEKVQRYIRRSVADVGTLQRYLAKSTIAELQVYKVSSLPWASWELGSKAAQAHELAEWLYWLQVTWPNTRAAAGVDREGPAIYNPYVGPY